MKKWTNVSMSVRYIVFSGMIFRDLTDVDEYFSDLFFGNLKISRPKHLEVL